MSEEEKRRCIILGICSPPPSFAGESEAESPRAVALREYLSTSTLSDDDAQLVLGLIDEALAMQGV